MHSLLPEDIALTPAGDNLEQVTFKIRPLTLNKTARTGFEYKQAMVFLRATSNRQ